MIHGTDKITGTNLWQDDVGDDKFKQIKLIVENYMKINVNNCFEIYIIV